MLPWHRNGKQVLCRWAYDRGGNIVVSEVVLPVRGSVPDESYVVLEHVGFMRHSGLTTPFSEIVPGDVFHEGAFRFHRNFPNLERCPSGGGSKTMELND